MGAVAPGPKITMVEAYFSGVDCGAGSMNVDVRSNRTSSVLALGIVTFARWPLGQDLFCVAPAVVSSTMLKGILALPLVVAGFSIDPYRFLSVGHRPRTIAAFSAKRFEGFLNPTIVLVGLRPRSIP